MLLSDERVLTVALVVEICRVRENKSEVRSLVHRN
jgi:hypothetical protein